MMQKKIVRGMCAALFDSDLIATRLALALAELLWALMLFWPGPTFDRPAYSVMREIAPEFCWASVFLVTAVMQYTIVALNACQSAAARWFSAWNAALWIMTIGSMMLSVYPPPAAVGGEVALMASAVWIWLRPLIVQHGEKLHA